MARSNSSRRALTEWPRFVELVTGLLYYFELALVK